MRGHLALRTGAAYALQRAPRGAKSSACNLVTLVVPAVAVVGNADMATAPFAGLVNTVKLFAVHAGSPTHLTFVFTETETIPASNTSI